MRDEIGTLYSDGDFATLFPTDGQPAISPWRLALICVMQFIEGLSDRQAAEAVRSRIDWKYALSFSTVSSDRLVQPTLHIFRDSLSVP